MKLIEKPQNISLDKWNIEQIELWIQVVNQTTIDRNNIQIFYKFSQLINDWHNLYHEFPSLEQTLLFLGFK